MRCCLPSLRPAAFPPPSPPPISVGFVRCFNGTTQPSDSSSVPRQLRLLDFLSRPGIAQATAGQTRSPRFRRDPFVRDVASDPGRATVPRITAPHMLPSAVATASAPATSRISWLNPTPQTITVYASPWSSPPTTQHSLPGGRYPFPGPDFHRLDRASFAWRTTNPLVFSGVGLAAIRSGDYKSRQCFATCPFANARLKKNRRAKCPLPSEQL